MKETFITATFRFPGQYHDRESRLYYNWNRYYIPSVGRYNQVDPLIIFEVRTFNYANNNPMKYFDEEGLLACSSSNLPDKANCLEITQDGWQYRMIATAVKQYAHIIPNFGCGATLNWDNLTLWWCSPWRKGSEGIF